MKTHARVVVIGGGVVGVSTLYHLAKKGWSDVVLIERAELTHGSTWHAAGLLPLFNMSYSVGQLHKYSVDLYKRLEAETGQDVSFHVTGNLRLATNQERMDEYHKYCGTANTIGVPFQMIGPAEIKALWPLCETVARRLKRTGLAGRGVTLKLKTADFQLLTRSRRLGDPSCLAEILYRAAAALLEQEADGRRFRLIGIGAHDLVDAALADPPDLLDPARLRQSQVERAIDLVRAKLGHRAIRRGRTLDDGGPQDEAAAPQANDD